MPENDTPQLTQLRQQIEEQFNEEELRALCFDLGVDYENLGGRGKAANVVELLGWAKRNERLSDLLALVKAARPHTPDVVALLPPHHIPYRRNELFTGREEWLSQLHEALKHDQPVAVTQAIAGLGGVGKTQLALAYCYRHLDEYHLIQWLRADDALTLGTELAELAYRLGLARRSVTDQAALHQLALNWLHTTNQRWLLVYDNADAIQPNELRPFLPKLGHGACLITSRNPTWGGLAQTMRLTHFSDAEAVAFLLGQPGLTPEAIASHPQGEAALRLAELLGHLPLALEHARAYVEETGCTLADYADYFENERQELWADTPPPADYDQKTITTTWELAFAQARQTPGAAALLNMCCFLAPDGIPLDLLIAAVGAEELPLPDDLVALANSKLKLDKAIAALRRYSLLTRDGDTLALHRLVQTVARDQMPPEIIQDWLLIAVHLLKQAWSFDQYKLESWPESASLLPHLLSVIAAAEKSKLETTEVASLNGQADFYLSYIGDFSSAKPFSERALAIDEKALGPDHPDVARDLNNLAALLQAVGEYEASRPYLERALAISEKALGPDHPQVAGGNNNLGQLLQAVGEYEAARPYMERALIIDEKALGPDHPSVARDLNNLGQLLQAVGAYEAARPYMERALAIDEKALGPDHPDVARDLNNLGMLMQTIGELDEAKSYLEQALRIKEKSLPPNHPSTIIGRDNLAALLAEIAGK